MLMTGWWWSRARESQTLGPTPRICKHISHYSALKLPTKFRENVHTVVSTHDTVTSVGCVETSGQCVGWSDPVVDWAQFHGHQPSPARRAINI